MNWMAKLSKKIAFIIACLTGTTGVAAAAPVTGGASLAGAVSADVSSIVIMLGGIVVIAILNNYDTKAGTGDMELKLTKNK